MHNLPHESPETAASSALLDAPDQPDLDPSMKLATHSEPRKHEQGHIASSSHPLHSLDNDSQSSSPMDLHHCRHPTSQIPHETTCMKDENRIPVNVKAEAVSPKNKIISQTTESAASIVDACLCGCGGSAMRCLRPNRPPSMPDDTFFDKSLDSFLANLIKDRLEVVVRDLEPSRRIWWREEFGGCAPDRKPLDSEIRSMRGDNLVSVLKTSLALFDDVTTIRSKAQHQPSRKRQRSTSLPTTATYRQDVNGNLPQDHTSLLNVAPKSAPLYSLYDSNKKCETSATEFGDSRSHDVRGRPLFRDPMVAPKAKSLKTPTFYIPDKLPPVKYNAPVRYHVPGKTPPINLAKLFLKPPPPRPKIEEPTAEEREMLRQSGLQKMEAAGRKMRHLLAMKAKKISLPLEDQASASKCDTVHQTQLDAELKRKARNTERFEQMDHRLNQNIEAMKVRKNSRHGTALYRHNRWVPDDSLTPHARHIGETPEKSMDQRMRHESYQSQKSLYRPLDMMKLRRNALTL